MNINPRANGFSYGIGWGTSVKPPVYHLATQFVRQLNKTANDASRIAWKFEMAIRDVRLAETDAEKRAAIAALEAEMQNHGCVLEAAQ